MNTLAELTEDLKVFREELQSTNRILSDTYENCTVYCAGRGGCLYCPLVKKNKYSNSSKGSGKIIRMFPR